MATTIEQVMLDPRGRATGFDYLRLVLSFGVVATHSLDVTMGLTDATRFETEQIRPLVAIILPLFFALSGFLVAGSLERCRTLVSFVGLRLIRLVPALAFETALAALILGPLLTSYSLGDYFRDPQFRHYFLNIVGEIQYLLPGLFQQNPWPNTVNAQLWTLPAELGCYAMIVLLALLGLHRRRSAFVVVVAALNALVFIRFTVLGQPGHGPVVPRDVLVLAFLYGIAIYLWRDRLHHSAKLGLGMLAAALVLLVNPVGDLLVAPLAAYAVTWLGLLRPRSTFVIRSGDYSYGIFLYGFPVQQTVVFILGPAFAHWYLNLAISLPLIVGLAMLSWHWVEAPMLKTRKQLLALEDRWMQLVASFRRSALFPAQ